MKSNYFNIVFVLFLIALNSNAQSTGYMGKRLVLNYGFHTSPVSFGASANNTTLIGTSGSAESAYSIDVDSRRQFELLCLVNG